MKRIAFAAAAALLGTGCISSTTNPPPAQTGSVIVYWDFVRTAPAQVGNGGYLVYDDSDEGTLDGACDQSRVDTVEVITPVSDFEVTCVYGGVEGVIADLIPAGTRTFRLLGWRGNTLVYDSGQVSLDVHAGMEMPYTIDLYGVSAAMDIAAYPAFGSPPPGASVLALSCDEVRSWMSSAFTPRIGIQIKDVFGTMVDTFSVACTNPLPAPVLGADLELDNYDVQLWIYPQENGAVSYFDSCVRRLNHFSSQTGGDGFAPVLYSTPGC